MALKDIAVVQRRPKVDPWTRVAQGLQIAQGIVGTVGGVQDIMAKSEAKDLAAQQLAEEKRRFQMGREELSEKEALTLGTPVKVKEGEEGSLISGREGKFKIVPHKKEVDPAKKARDERARLKFESEQALLKAQKTIPGMGEVDDPDQKKNILDAKIQTEKTVSGLNALLDLNKKDLSKLDPREKAKAKFLTKALIGDLRVKIVGPGAFTEKEIEILEDIVANPTDLFSIPAVTQAKLQSAIDKFSEDFAIEARSRGVDFSKGDAAKSPYAKYLKKKPPKQPPKQVEVNGVVYNVGEVISVGGKQYEVQADGTALEVK